MDLRERVATLIREVAGDELTARFRRLEPGQIRHKDGRELVTEADLAAEARLSEGLGRLLPGSVVIGEEGVAAEPGRMRAIAGPGWVWIIDPLDGTHHFAAGEEPFGVIVALARDGVAEMAWIYLPIPDQMAIAERGNGAAVDGEPARLGAAVDRPTGVILDRFFPDELRARVTRGFADLERRAAKRCAAEHYLALLRKEIQFALYYRTRIWDHAAGVLLVSEAGGRARRFDGSAYRLRSPASGLLVAADPALWNALSDRVAGRI